MKTTAYTLPLLLTVLGLFFSCMHPDCGDPAITSIPLHDDQKALIPYTGNETLIFYNQFGDTSYLIGKGVTHKYVDYQTDQSGGMDCSGNITRAEIIEYSYEKDPVRSPHTQLYSLLVTNESYNHEWRVNNFIFFYSTFGCPAGQWGGNLVPAKLTDSLWMNGIRYSVSAITSGCRTSQSVIPDTFFYNPSYGLLQISNQDSTIWKRKF
jgi:hypothetical protein